MAPSSFEQTATEFSLILLQQQRISDSLKDRAGKHVEMEADAASLLGPVQRNFRRTPQHLIMGSFLLLALRHIASEVAFRRSSDDSSLEATIFSAYRYRLPRRIF